MSLAAFVIDRILQQRGAAQSSVDCYGSLSGLFRPLHFSANLRSHRINVLGLPTRSQKGCLIQIPSYFCSLGPDAMPARGVPIHVRIVGMAGLPQLNKLGQFLILSCFEQNLRQRLIV